MRLPPSGARAKNWHADVPLEGSNANSRTIDVRPTPRTLGAGEINGESRLFVTERDDQNKVKCLNIKAESIRHNLETGTAINIDDLIAS
jgi:hypothetical protein